MKREWTEGNKQTYNGKVARAIERGGNKKRRSHLLSCFLLSPAVRLQHIGERATQVFEQVEFIYVTFPLTILNFRFLKKEKKRGNQRK